MFQYLVFDLLRLIINSVIERNLCHSSFISTTKFRYLHTVIYFILLLHQITLITLDYQDTVTAEKAKGYVFRIAVK